MRTIRGVLLSLLLIVSQAPSQQLSDKTARRFVESLIYGRESPSGFVHPDELKYSSRLNISYPGVEHKFLIAADIDPAMKNGIIGGSLAYAIQRDSLDHGYTKLHFSIASNGYGRDYYFNGEKLISAISYFSRNWQQRTSEHFRFFLPDTSLFNSYSIGQLEQFLGQMFLVFNISGERRELLQKEKICYFLCKDENEIEQLTGFRTMGMYVLADDFLVTTYNCHYHELVHLLVNYTLQTPPLYTHPFLQEGIAVALGGRGGKEPGTILDAGYFLIRSGMQGLRELFAPSGFAQYDPSIAYPVSGLYNNFLLSSEGFDKYFSLYRSLSAAAGIPDSLTLHPEQLPDSNEWNSYLRRYAQHASLLFAEDTSTLIQSGPAFRIFANDSLYTFQIQDTLLLAPETPIRGYRSKKFEELMPTRSYAGEKYLIVADSGEINLYNLYTNNLIASYVAGFAIPMEPVPHRDGRYRFSLRKRVFDEDLGTMTVR